MRLVKTVNEPIYRGDNLCRKLIFLIPLNVGDIDIESAALYLSYIRSDGTADIMLLNRLEEKYKESYYRYSVPVTSTLTRYPGEIVLWLQIYAGSPHSPVIAKSGECVLHITESTNMDEYISDRNLSLIYMMQKQMEDKIEKAETGLTERIDKTDEAVAAKADNIIFDAENSTIQLVSTIVETDEEGIETEKQLPLGEPIFVRADTAREIQNLEINEFGELIVLFGDGGTQNLGRVVGTDGAVYVPHISERKILTFTVEDEPNGIPDPVDMNPSDEWSGISDSGTQADTANSYTWDSI